MKYLCLVYGEERLLGAMDDAECVAFDESVRDKGKCLSSEALEAVETGRTVRVRDGKTTVTDGPFAETKEALAGFYLIDAKDMDEAVEIASGIPPARVGCVEVRAVRQLKGRRDYR